MRLSLFYLLLTTHSFKGSYNGFLHFLYFFWSSIFPACLTNETEQHVGGRERTQMDHAIPKHRMSS